MINHSIRKLFIMNSINGQKIIFLKTLLIVFIRNKYYKIAQIEKHKKLKLFIDVIKIVNKLGSESVVIHCENKKKKYYSY